MPRLNSNISTLTFLGLVRIKISQTTIWRMKLNCCAIKDSTHSTSLHAKTSGLTALTDKSFPPNRIKMKSGLSVRAFSNNKESTFIVFNFPPLTP